jgi:uncharacterized protein DUF4255
MSNASAIAATTATLRKLLEDGVAPRDPDLAGLSVTTEPLDRARTNGNQSGLQLNLFLYQTVLSGAWRNMDVPSQIAADGAGKPAVSLSKPPLALTLHYVITPYGNVDSGKGDLSQRLLGAAMSVLHDHAVLSAAEIKDKVTGSDLHLQVERVRITPQPMSIEEISKLWTAFQTSYRLSTAYEVAVILIDSTLTPRAPLPVLKRGREDRGVFAVASGSPSLTEVRPPNSLPAVRLGEDLTLSGRNLDGDGIGVRFGGPLLATPIPVKPSPGPEPETLTVHLPDPVTEPAAQSAWAPGIYTLSLVVGRTDLPSWTSNEIPFALAPTVTVQPRNAAPGDFTLTVTCSPRIREGQRVALLFGDRQVAVETLSNPLDATQPTVLTFVVRGATARTEPYPIRLRVDGVDSTPLPLTRPDAPPPRPEFDSSQRVAVP